MNAIPMADIVQSYAVRLMQHLVVPTFVLDPNRKVVVWNLACERLTGVAAADVVGTAEHWKAFYESKRYCLADLVVLDRPDRLASLYPQHTISNNGLGLSAENWCIMPKLGNRLYLAIDAGPIHDEDGILVAVVETLRDMTDYKRSEAALKSLAASDGLTSLANRRTFDQTFLMEWSRALRTKKPLSLVLADVDHFKLYNDLYGHQRGDECLRSIASLLERNTRPTDLCARYGGEEFAIILPDTDHAGACQIIERLQKELELVNLPHGACGAGPFVALSLGVATQVPRSELEGEWLFKQADDALYAAKRSGRNCFVSASDAVEVLTSRKARAARRSCK